MISVGDSCCLCSRDSDPYGKPVEPTRDFMGFSSYVVKPKNRRIDFETSQFTFSASGYPKNSIASRVDHWSGYLRHKNPKDPRRPMNRQVFKSAALRLNLLLDRPVYGPTDA